MKGVVVYKGKYGATEQYACWIGQELGFPIIHADNISGNTLNLYDVVILGSSVYLGKLQMAKWLKKNFSFIKSKKIFLYQVAGAPPSELKKREDFNRKSLSGKILEKCDVFYLAGRLIIHKLSWFDRFLLKMGARLAKDTADKKIMLADYDHVKKENIQSLVTAVNYFTTPKRCDIPGKQPLACSI